jgi:hypothetical protein
MHRATLLLGVMLASLVLLVAPVRAQPKKAPLCDQLLSHLNTRVRLTPYQLEESDLGEGRLGIHNEDVDGDKKPDELILFRTGSASLIPPDNSTVTLTLSSTGEEFTIEFQRFYVIRFGPGVYVVGGNMVSESGPVETEIHRVGRTGFTRVCSYQCGLTTACTRTRAKAARAGNAER